MIIMHVCRERETQASRGRAFLAKLVAIRYEHIYIERGTQYLAKLVAISEQRPRAALYLLATNFARYCVPLSPYVCSYLIATNFARNLGASKLGNC
jgi:hypothetical protein